MNKKLKNSRLQLLRVSSLLLLLCFLIFWLFNEYKSQEDRLEQDINSIFSTVMRDIRFSDLEALALKIDREPESLKGVNDTLVQTGIDQTVFVTKRFMDSSFHMPYSKKGVSEMSDIKIKITTDDSEDSGEGDDDEDTQITTKNFSSISMIASVSESDSNKTTYDLDLTKSTTSVEEVTQNFTDTLFQSLADFRVKVVEVIAKDSVPEFTGLTTKVQSGDLTGNGLFVAQIGEYDTFILKNMLPQILFSIFLFSITTLSFWLIYSSLKKQQRLTEIKNDFIANITHELKTPITTVGVALEAISDFEVIKNPEKTKEYLQISRNELGRLSLLVDKVLQLSKLEKQSPRLKIESLSLDELIAQILESMKLQFEREKALIEFYKANERVTIEGDRLHLMSVIYNLIDNALKYRKHTPKITIRLEDLGERIKLVIQDNGIGIPQAYQQKIFDKFFRIPTGDQHNVKGHGLGLNYVFQIVKQHHGNIELESQEGEGSTFAVLLPKTQQLA